VKKLMLGLCILVAVAASGCTTASKDMRVNDKGFKCLSDNDLVKAEALFNDALAINPDNLYAILNLGVVYEKTGRKAEAKTMYMKVINSGATAAAGKTTGEIEAGTSLVDIAKKNLADMK